MVDKNAELFIKLYSKMSVALGVTPATEPGRDAAPADDEAVAPRAATLGTRPESTNFLLAIYNPGQYIPAGMDPVKNPDDRYALSVLLDVVPQFSWVFKPAATTVSQAYKSVLDYKEFPDVSLKPSQKAKLEDAVKTRDKYAANYRKYENKYFLVLDQYDAAKATADNGGAPIPSSLRLKLKSAMADWKANHKEGYESAAAVIAELESLEPAAYWADLREKYDTGTQTTTTDSEFQSTGFSPPYRSWFEDFGWTRFVFDQKDMDNQSESRVIGVSGSLDGTFGIFTISGSGDYNEEKSYKKVDQTELRFECELMRISLDRRWMNSLVFSGRAWRFAPGTPVHDTQLSNGADFTQDEAPTGTMTVIPTAAILSRNLKVTGQFDNTIVTALNREINAEASVGIGPFSIAGKFNMENHEGSEKGTIASDSITAASPQIVALVCEALPKSPNPDSALPWPV